MRQGTLSAAAAVAFAILAGAAACGELKEGRDDPDATSARADATTDPLGDGAASTSGGPDGATPEGSRDYEWAMWPLPAAAPANGDYAVTTETVLDERTRLVWQRASTSGASLAQARASCDALDLEGASDWRLPTRIELLSLVDYGRGAPSLNPVAFAPATETGTFWSTSADARDPAGKAWTVAFGTGTTEASATSTEQRVRCVRGTPPARVHYTQSVETTKDEWTGLTWQRAVAPVRTTWADAVAACQSARTEGKTGWRMPTVRELESLVDVRAASAPTWDTSAFAANEAGIVLWSITTVPSQPDHVFVVEFSPERATSTLEASALARTRCVTGP